MTVYYNDNSSACCIALRGLMGDGLIPQGYVDDRDISALTSIDVRGCDQVHFFAGGGGWAIACQLAGVTGNTPIWTASCPCQPFSSAGQQHGVRDRRHVWPAIRRLIAECNPPIIVGEQVASSAGRAWMSGVRLDLEALGYAVGCADLCAASIGAQHIRQRLYWIAYAPGVSGKAWSCVGTGGARKDKRALGGVRRISISAREWQSSKGSSHQPIFYRRADGVSDALGILGNAVVPQLAAAFLIAALGAQR